MNYYFTYGLLIPLLASILLIIILYSQNKKKKELVEKLVFEKHNLETLRKEEIKDYFKEEWSKEKEKLDDDIANAKKQAELTKALNDQAFYQQTQKAQAEIEKLQTELQEKEARYKEVNQDLDLYREGKIKEIDSATEEYKQRKQLIVENSIDSYRDFKIELANASLLAKQNEIDTTNSEIEKLKFELENQRKIRAAINEEIRRQREVEEQQDFYRIQFSDEDKNDVEILRSVAPRLRHPEAINKVIWNAYYQKPLAELRKRAGIEGSGVYKITRIKTGEIYIGQAVNVSTRWAEHCKSALGVGTLASSQLHRAMAQDGCENFIFELLEETPKEKLRERESYYIDFYDSKNYGLNTVSGDKR